MPIPSQTDQLPVLPIIRSEERFAIRQLKENKSPGPDKITNDFLKNTGEALLKKLAELFIECLHQSKIAEQR